MAYDPLRAKQRVQKRIGYGSMPPLPPSAKNYTTILLPRGDGPISGCCATLVVRDTSFVQAARQVGGLNGRTLLVSDGRTTKAFRAEGLKEV